MTTITLNGTIRNLAAINPTYLLTVIGMYAGSGKVNELNVDTVHEAVTRAHAGVNSTPTPERDEFESEQAYTDQFNQLIIMRALAGRLNYPLVVDTVPAMMDEMYNRIDNDEETRAAYIAISESTRRMENAFMHKARAELN